MHGLVILQSLAFYLLVSRLTLGRHIWDQALLWYVWARLVAYIQWAGTLLMYWINAQGVLYLFMCGASTGPELGSLLMSDSIEQSTGIDLASPTHENQVWYRTRSTKLFMQSSNSFHFVIYWCFGWGGPILYLSRQFMGLWSGCHSSQMKITALGYIHA